MINSIINDKMSIHLIKLIGKKQIAKDTMEFVFEKPDSFLFRAGHFGGVTLLDPKEEDSLGNLREFSFASAPHEKNLSIAARLRDTAYKRSLHSLAPGDIVRLDGSYGEFVLDREEAESVVFLSGGIGIAPVRSIIRQMGLSMIKKRRIVLIHINQRKEYAPYEDEFIAMMNQHPNFTYHSVYTRGENRTEKDRIGDDIIRPILESLRLPFFYISGTEGMVRGMRQELMSMGVDEDKIRTEEFGSY